MGFTDETVRFDFDDNRKKAISETLETVYRALEEKGYNPINQIVGYYFLGTRLTFLVIKMLET